MEFQCCRTPQRIGIQLQDTQLAEKLTVLETFDCFEVFSATGDPLLVSDHAFLEAFERHALYFDVVLLHKFFHRPGWEAPRIRESRVIP